MRGKHDFTIDSAISFLSRPCAAIFLSTQFSTHVQINFNNSKSFANVAMAGMPAFSLSAMVDTMRSRMTWVFNDPFTFTKSRISRAISSMFAAVVVAGWQCVYNGGENKFTQVGTPEFHATAPLLVSVAEVPSPARNVPLVLKLYAANVPDGIFTRFIDGVKLAEYHATLEIRSPVMREPFNRLLPAALLYCLPIWHPVLMFSAVVTAEGEM